MLKDTVRYLGIASDMSGVKGSPNIKENRQEAVSSQRVIKDGHSHRLGEFRRLIVDVRHPHADRCRS